MACDDATTAAAEAALTLALASPLEVSVDGLTTRQQRLRDLIEADKYTRARCAAGHPARGIRFTRLIPPGAT